MYKERQILKKDTRVIVWNGAPHRINIKPF